MSQDNFIIRNMTREDLDWAVDWAAVEGWNPGLHDADAFYAQDPKGFFIGELDGKPVASVSAVNYDDHYAFAGFFIVTPEHRGQGYGRAVSMRGLEYMGDRIVGIDGVAAQQENYKTSGFVYAFPSYRFQAAGGGDVPAGVSQLSELPWDQVLAYDRTCFPALRAGFLDKWVNAPGTAALAAAPGGKLQGYGVIRQCREGRKIGPLFADNEQAAELLFQGLLAQAPNQPVFLDAPENNPLAMALVKRHGLHEVFQTARMYKNGAPQWAPEKVFGITSFELG